MPTFTDVNVDVAAQKVTATMSDGSIVELFPLASAPVAQNVEIVLDITPGATPTATVVSAMNK